MSCRARRASRAGAEDPEAEGRLQKTQRNSWDFLCGKAELWLSPLSRCSNSMSWRSMAKLCRNYDEILVKFRSYS